MQKKWRKWRKKKIMEQVEKIENEEMNPRVETPVVEQIEPTKFKVREYKPRFARVTGYRLPEDSKVHCGNGEELSGSAGDFYICLDQVHEMVISAEIFKKLFLPKIDTETV